MARYVLVAAAVLVAAVVAGCTSGDDSSPSSSPMTAPSVSSTTTPSPPTATSSTETPQVRPTTTSTPEPPAVDLQFSVDGYGQTPAISLGPTAALGSGCGPGTDSLPDGIWFGWVEAAVLRGVDFDLACLWPGRLEPAASNDASRLRRLTVSDSTRVYVGTSEPVLYAEWSREPVEADNAPGLPGTLPYWVFINAGVATEIAQHRQPIVWAQTTTGWPPGLAPGCCEAGDVAPASPVDPWPKIGWPTDGFYKVWFADSEGRRAWFEPDPEDAHQINLAKWLRCADHPSEGCAPWWTGDEVFIDREAESIQRTLNLNEDLTVVISPIFGDGELVGHGRAFAAMLTDLDDAVREWISNPQVPPPDTQEFVDLGSDPAFPFGVPDSEYSDGSWPLGYRGPGGVYLTWEEGWMALEIRRGLPILYIHAGLVAG
jgi:hypothetical protein